METEDRRYRVISLSREGDATEYYRIDSEEDMLDLWLDLATGDSPKMEAILFEPPLESCDNFHFSSRDTKEKGSIGS